MQRIQLGIVVLASMLFIPWEASTNPVGEENSNPGNLASEWDIVGAGDLSIQGYATDISVDVGETVRFKVKTDATDYRVDIYRLGYYQGLGARLIATIVPSVTLPQIQPTPLVDATTGLIDCGNWSESAMWQVPTNAVSGIYLGRLVRTDTSGASHIPFIVRNDQGQSDILFQTSDTTWQAYNGYGGRNLYDYFGTTQARAYKVSYNRPFITRSSIQWASLFTAEYPMVRWLEANGYDVSYISGVDTDRYGSLLTNQHSAFLSVGHDEYWSGTQRANVEAARDAGVHLAFLSGNEMFWKTRWESSIDGSNTPYRTLVCYKETAANAKIDPSPVWTGTWRDPRFSPPSDGGRAENGLIGTLFRVNGISLNSLEVPPAYGKHRFWRNTSVAILSSNERAVFAPGTLGFEWDECPDNSHRPAGLMRLSSTITNGVPVLQNYGSTYASGTATHNLSLYRHESGALVFGAGTVLWSWGLDDVHDNALPGGAADIRLQQAMVNLLADMGIQPATLKTGLLAAAQSTDFTAPTSTIGHPLPEAVLEPGTPLTISGTATDEDSQVWSVEISMDGGLTWVTASGTTNWTLEWTPALTGVVTLLSRAVDENGNLQSPPSARPVTVLGSQLTIWAESASPLNSGAGHDNHVEVGVKFICDVPGLVRGVRFYKAESSKGPHFGHLWTGSGILLASSTFSGETVRGWQQANFPSAVEVSANTLYVASYHLPDGHYSFTKDYFTTTGVTNGVVQAPPTLVSGPNGVFSYGPSASFPENSYFDGNYWVDVAFSPGVPPKILSFEVVEGSTITITWSAISNETYVIEYTDSLPAGTWTKLMPSITATSSIATSTNTAIGVTSRFYRVQHLLD